jgi:hypothetical protein
LDFKAAIEYELEMTAMLLSGRSDIKKEMRDFIKDKAYKKEPGQC